MNLKCQAQFLAYVDTQRNDTTVVESRCILKMKRTIFSLGACYTGLKCMFLGSWVRKENLEARSIMPCQYHRLTPAHSLPGRLPSATFFLVAGDAQLGTVWCNYYSVIPNNCPVLFQMWKHYVTSPNYRRTYEINVFLSYFVRKEFTSFCLQRKIQLVWCPLTRKHWLLLPALSAP